MHEKQIDQMAQILQKHNLGDHIPEGAKKNPKDHAPRKGNSIHALIAINSFPYAWIVDLAYLTTWLPPRKPSRQWMHAKVLLYSWGMILLLISLVREELNSW